MERYSPQMRWLRRQSVNLCTAAFIAVFLGSDLFAALGNQNLATAGAFVSLAFILIGLVCWGWVVEHPPVEIACQACNGYGYKPNVALMILEPCAVCQPESESDPAAKVGPRSRRSPLAERLEAV
jgi:hypothetical protein